LALRFRRRLLPLLLLLLLLRADQVIE